MVARSKGVKFTKLKKSDKEKINLAYVAGISSLGMAYKMSLADIDIAEALLVEKEAMNLSVDCYSYFNKFNPSMLMKISCNAVNISKNLDKYHVGIQEFVI